MIADDNERFRERSSSFRQLDLRLAHILQSRVSRVKITMANHGHHRPYCPNEIGNLRYPALGYPATVF